MDIKKVSVPLTSYPRYTYTSSLATRMYKRFNYLLSKTELNEDKLHLPPNYGDSDVYIIHASSTVKHLNESFIKLKRIPGNLDHVHKLPTTNELRSEGISEFKEKVLVVVTEDVDDSIDLVREFSHNTVVACSTGDIAFITKKHTFIQELDVPVVDIGVSDSVALAIDGMLERIVFRKLYELLNVLACFRVVNKSRLVQTSVSDKMTDYMRGMLGKGAKTIRGLFIEVKQNVDARSQFAVTKDTTDTEIDLPYELTSIHDIKERYTEELRDLYMLLYKMSVDISHTIEQFVHGKCRELPEKFRVLWPILLAVGTISEPLQVDVLKLLVVQFPKDLKLDDRGDAQEIDQFLEILNPERKQLVEELVKMISRVTLVQDVDRRINHVKKLYDSSFHRLTWEINAMYTRSKVPKREKPLSGNEGKRLSREVAERLLERINPFFGVGYRCDKLQVHIHEKSNTDRDTVNTEIKDVLAEFHITEFSVVSLKERFTHYRRVGASIKAARKGTLGGFSWMIGKDKAGTKPNGDKGPSDVNRQLCALISKHVAIGNDKIYLIPSTPENEIIHIGSIIQASEAVGNRSEALGVDMAAVKILFDEQSRCDIRFRNTRRESISSRLYNDTNVDYLMGLPVHFFGATTNLGRGTIMTPEYYARDPLPQDRNVTFRYVLIEDIESVEEMNARFCTMGDSGAIICADNPDGEFVDVISMLNGSVNYHEVEQNPDTIGQYLTFSMTDGLNQLHTETGCTFELCSD